MKLTEAINKLKAGIEECDDDLIEEGFFLLTGERVVFPDEDPSMFAGGAHPHKMTPAFPLGIIPNNIIIFFSELSKFCLLAAIAAVGTKTNLQNLKVIGFTITHLHFFLNFCR